MASVKKGLSLILFGIFIAILALIARVVIPFVIDSNVDKEAYGLAMLVITIAVIVGFVFELIGLSVAGKGNSSLHLASLMKALSIIFAFTSLILNYIGSTQNNPSLVTASAWINFALSIWELLVLYNILKGCKSVANVNGLAKAIFLMEFVSVAWYVFTAIVTTIPDFPWKDSSAFTTASKVITLVLGIVVILANALYVVLVAQTRAQIGAKSQKNNIR